MTLMSVVVMLWDWAPEILLQSTCVTPVVMCCVGSLFSEMFCWKPLFFGNLRLTNCAKIIVINGLPSDDDWP